MIEDPNLSVCHFIAALFLWAATMFSMICVVGALMTGLWATAALYGIGTMVLGSSLKLVLKQWFGV